MLGVAEVFTAEQTALDETLSRLLTRSAVEDLDRDFHSFGGLALLVPQAHGGIGLGSVEAALVARAMGRHCSKLAYLGHFVATRALVRVGAHDRWLEMIVAENCRIAASMRKQVISMQNGHLSADATFVIDAPDSHAVLLRSQDNSLYLVPRQAGVGEEVLITVDRSRRIANLRLVSVAADRLAVSADDVLHLVGLERLLVAAETLGACESLLDRALAYAQERRQFGRPIGSFQAIKHLCAELATELDLARSLVWSAAARHAADHASAALSCTQAKAHMDEVARAVARGAIEIHGAMGIAAESGLHLWSKRIAVNRNLGGAPEVLRREIATMVGWVE